MITACDQSDDPERQRQDPAADKGKEAPVLADQVKAGDLPAVEDRLPGSPPVVEPVDRIGVYGGTWNTAVLGPADTAWLTRTIGYDYLVRWDPEWTEVLPNVAEAFELAQDGREYTFTLREGLRWSDGEPFTADDIVFAIDDVLNNTELFPSGPPALYASADGEPATIEAVDDYTVRFTFSQPKGLFLEELATPVGGPAVTAHPRHYLEQFHAEYADDAAELAEEAGSPSWTEHYLERSDRWQNAELPTLFPWQLTETLGEGTQVTAERNPYYWKTDPDGSQLPYIDEVVYDVIDDAEVMLLKATNGELNMHTRHFNSLENKPVLARSREEAGFRFIDLVPSQMNDMLIMLNLTHQTPELREVFQNRDFRIGLSHAINREELNNTVYQRQGEPWQAAPRREATFFDEEFAKQYTEYDEDLANEFLDRAGYSERDGDGFRLRPDGERISFAVEVAVPAPNANWTSAMELVVEYWAAVGVDISIKSEDRSLWAERVAANQHDAAVWGGPGGIDVDAILSGHHYLPFHAGSRYAIAWVDWYLSGGEAGEEPPEMPRRQLDLYDQLLSSVDPAERDTLFREILEIAKEEFYVIGTLQLTQSYGIVADDFHNVPGSMADAWLYPNPGPTQPEQYFIA